MVGCCACGCKNSTRKGFNMKRFPSNPERRKVWAAKVKRENWAPTDASRLCEAHFKPEMFEQNRADGKRKLRWNAIPTIFPHIPQKKSRKPPIRNKCESKELVAAVTNELEDPNYASYCDEEENYKISKNIGITIKVEPGLTDYVYQDDVSTEDTKDFLAGWIRFKEVADPDCMNQGEHMDSMMDIHKTYIKPEDGIYLTVLDTDVKIKIEPGLNEDEVSHDYKT